MIAPACDRPTVAVPIRAQGHHVMESESAAMHRKIRQQACQLPITGFAHKARNGRRPLNLAAVTDIVRSARLQRRAGGWPIARRSCCRFRTSTSCTPTVSPSRTAASLQPTMLASHSAGRTTAPTARRAGRRCDCIRTSSSGASCCTCYRKASIASATTGSWPAPTAPRASQRPAHSSVSLRLPPTRNSRRTSHRTRRACCAAHARTAAPA
jgi:hypothetical protein